VAALQRQQRLRHEQAQLEASLPAEQREVLLLVTVEECSYGETAGILGIPVGTVMSRLSRARDRLREILAESGDTARLRVVK